MKFAFAPRGEYRPGQKITLLGSIWVIESVAHTGRQLIAHTPERAPKFERITVILTDEPPIEGDTSMKYTASFLPQAWINDYAVEVDAQGPTTFDVTDELMLLSEDDRAQFVASSVDNDYLKDTGNEPEWIQDWTGPFEVYVHEEIPT